METRRSDLAIENFGIEISAADLLFPDQNSVSHGIPMLISRKNGNIYESLVCGKLWLYDTNERSNVSLALSERLRELLRSVGETSSPTKKYLTVGIGNRLVSSDALGPYVTDHLVINGDDGEQHYPRTYAISPGILSCTGIDTAKQIKGIVRDLRPDALITVDSLAARNYDHLQTIIQLTDSGMTPGSAMNHTTGEITRSSIGCPVISIGVPMVIRSDGICNASAEENENTFVTRAETDMITDCYARVIADAINNSLYGNISL